MAAARLDPVRGEERTYADSDIEYDSDHIPDFQVRVGSSDAYMAANFIIQELRRKFSISEVAREVIERNRIAKQAAVGRLKTEVIRRRANSLEGRRKRREKHKTLFIETPSSDSECPLELEKPEEQVDSDKESLDEVDRKADSVFVRFCRSEKMVEVVDLFGEVRAEAGLGPGPGPVHTVLPALQQHFTPLVPFQYGELLRLLAARAAAREYHTRLTNLKINPLKTFYTTIAVQGREGLWYFFPDNREIHVFFLIRQEL